VAARKLRLRKERRVAGAFLVEGVRVVSEALRSRHRVRELFITDEVARRQPQLVRQADEVGARITVVTERVAAALGETVHPQGIHAIVDVPANDIDTVLASGLRLVVLLNAIADPGNAGTVIRTAAAVGADAVVFCGNAVDPYAAKCVRASAGAVLHIPLATEVDVATAVQRLHRVGAQVFAAALDGTDLFTLGDELRQPTAWLFGSEAHGLDVHDVAAADQMVRIPMSRGVESLNLAAAAAVCLYASAQALGIR
jgi:TrmH family RNA methyltransferase